MLLSDSHEMIRGATRDFAKAQIAPMSRVWEHAREIPQSIFTQLGGLGLMGMTVPEPLGGAGLDHVSYVLALIEIAAADGSLSTIMSVNNAPVCATLLTSGSGDQQKRFLGNLARGEMIGAFALTEPQAGSDAANLRMQARRVSGGYRLSGTKQFITSGSIAGVIVTFAVTDPAAGRNGISAFLVPRGIEGLHVARVEAKLGQRASDTAQLIYDDVFVSEELLLGLEGNGYRIALANLECGRIGIGAQAVGMARSAYEHALAYARQRTAFGKPLIDHQALAFRFADMATQVECALQMVLHAAALKDAGRPCLREASMAKLHASEMAEQVASAAMQILGGYGYTEDFLIEKIYRDVRACQIYEGTSDVQRMLIARHLSVD